MSAVHRRCRRLLTLGLALVLAAIAAPAAQAGVLVTTTTSCADQPFSQPFIPWLDYANYVLAPDGGLEAGAAGWTLTGGAAVVAGNEPWSVRASGDASRLDLLAGSSATTPAMCVGLEHPALRFFVRRSDGSPLSSLRADVLFEDAAGDVHAVTIGAVGGLAASSWQLSAPMAVVANLLALLPGDRTPVAFRLVPQGGAWQVDDLYVDPYKHG